MGTPPPYDEGNVRPIRITFIKIPTATLGLFWLNSNEHFPYDRTGSGVHVQMYPYDKKYRVIDPRFVCFRIRSVMSENMNSQLQKRKKL